MNAIFHGHRYKIASADREEGVQLQDGPFAFYSDKGLNVDPTDILWEAAKDPEVNVHPIYTETDEHLEPGLWLALFHGRNERDKQLNDWGFNGPVIGPLKYAHTTYGEHLKMEFVSADAHDRYFPREPSSWSRGMEEVQTWSEHGELYVSEGLIEYQGKFYGDWTLFNRDPWNVVKPKTEQKGTPNGKSKRRKPR